MMQVSFYFHLSFIALALATSNKQDNIKNYLARNEKSEVFTAPSDGETTVGRWKRTILSFFMAGNTTNPRALKEERQCREMIGMDVDGMFQGPEIRYNLSKILEKYGGPPGKVNATWTEKDAALVHNQDLEKQPLPDADQDYWLYKYGDTDGKTYIRTEHAVRRFSGTPKAFLEIRGTIYFTPEDFCRRARKAVYTMDDRGFTFEFSRVYCWIGTAVSCAWPATCHTDGKGEITTCIAAPPGKISLAALVGA